MDENFDDDIKFDTHLDQSKLLFQIEQEEKKIKHLTNEHKILSEKVEKIAAKEKKEKLFERLNALAQNVANMGETMKEASESIKQAVHLKQKHLEGLKLQRSLLEKRKSDLNDDILALANRLSSSAPSTPSLLSLLFFLLIIIFIFSTLIWLYQGQGERP
eukprot:TRINITY_DN20296_c0_g1_i1.p1 TRINITY_DN20296_c0_g1~~TRINITY_DN20296_c0_g1_i1.p1  ORF type:complete len:160 (-),score=45.15 TRINITY_DN20296_c0_g1_i1:32-511(-)